MIPREMQERNQWVAAGLDKLPINPNTGKVADVNKPQTWGSYAAAIACGKPHIGFVLHSSDPYTIIDLDDPFKRSNGSRILSSHKDYDEALIKAERHKRILQAAESYAETSQSGTGVHIIVKGEIPQGRRRDRVEIYSTARYMICTGRRLNTLPICERQEFLDILYTEMSRGFGEGGSFVPEIITDGDLVDMASRAINGDKFTALCNGEWQHEYPSQSEADYALLSILCYYSKNDEQVKRIFRRSKLGEREKAQKDVYLDRSIRGIRIAAPPPVHIDIPKPDLDQPEEPEETFDEPKKEEPAPVNYDPIAFPGGLVGDIAEFALVYGVRPTREVALAAAIALVAGIVGRSYNVSSTGLNQYILLTARTGSGKELAAQVIEALASAVRSQVPDIDRFLGPSAFASGQAIIRAIDENPCFVSVLGEFGTTLQQLSHPRANTAEIAYKKVLLDLYGKSGWRQTLRPTAYSDREKNTKLIQAPAVSILGETAPEEFFGNISESTVSSGLLPRFLHIAYEGARPERNLDPYCEPPEALVTALAELTAIAITTRQNNSCAPVLIDPAAREILDQFDRRADSQMRQSQGEAHLQCWNRAHLKALKLAALVAVGVNPHDPVVDLPTAQWAVELVDKETVALLARFGDGQMGGGGAKRFALVRSFIEDWLAFPARKRAGYGAGKLLQRGPIVPVNYLLIRARMKQEFKHDTKSVKSFLDDILAEMADADLIVRISREQAAGEFETKASLFTIGGAWKKV